MKLFLLIPQVQKVTPIPCAGDLTVKDKIVTLSTCTGNQATRYVVQGRRVDALDVAQ